MGKNKDYNIQLQPIWCMSIVGLDLAGVETRPTGFCKLTRLTAETSTLFTDREILENTAQSSPCLVAIDAPLCLPPGRASIEDKTGSHLRDCDRALIKLGIKLFPITLGPMRKLTVRGIRLKDELNAKGLTVIEAYPGGAQDVLGIPRKQKGLAGLLLGLQRLGIEGLNSGMNDHELDAVTCAYVGWLYSEGKSAAYGDSNHVVVMPMGPKKLL